jgi:hypothetical protein
MHANQNKTGFLSKPEFFNTILVNVRVSCSPDMGFAGVFLIIGGFSLFSS